MSSSSSSSSSSDFDELEPDLHELNAALRAADSLERVSSLIEAGARDLRGCVESAAERGNMPLVRDVLRFDGTLNDAALFGVAAGGRVEHMRLLGPPTSDASVSAIAARAARHGHELILDELGGEWVSTIIDRVAVAAASGGHEALFRRYYAAAGELYTSRGVVWTGDRVTLLRALEYAGRNGCINILPPLMSIFGEFLVPMADPERITVAAAAFEGRCADFAFSCIAPVALDATRVELLLTAAARADDQPSVARLLKRFAGDPQDGLRAILMGAFVGRHAATIGPLLERVIALELAESCFIWACQYRLPDIAKVLSNMIAATPTNRHRLMSVVEKAIRWAIIEGHDRLVWALTRHIIGTPYYAHADGLDEVDIDENVSTDLLECYNKLVEAADSGRVWLRRAFMEFVRAGCLMSDCGLRFTPRDIKFMLSRGWIRGASRHDEMYTLPATWRVHRMRETLASLTRLPLVLIDLICGY